jgi:hypothetical protein
MLGAIPILALSCGAATSQVSATSQILNNQIQLGDIIAGQTLDVVEATDNVGVVTVATGNAIVGGSQGRNLNVSSYQELQGAVQAHGVVNVGASMGATGSLTTAATGNTAETVVNNAVLTAVKTQITGPGTVSAVGQLEAEEAYVGDLSHNTQAAANSIGLGLTNGSLGVRTSQYNEANVLADGGAIAGEATGQATVNANAAGNNLTSVGAGASSQRLIATQGNTSEAVQASKFTAYGQSYTSNTNASASANNINATNEGPLLDVTTSQSNSAYVRAQSEGTSAVFSSHAVTAYGIGNSTVAGNMGAELVLDNSQFNEGGGVEVIAVGDVGTGWDSTTSASASGNAVTGYACAACTAKMTVDNNQTNTTDISSQVTSRMGYGRSVTGLSSAVGNNASFYVSAPANSAQ